MDAAAKQQIVERVKQATNILVTVSSNPTVDQLAACIGLTLLLNKMTKHATAVFSGTVPSTLEFLQPEKTIETNTDSLQDFIISLDKNKADKLRYKVEDKVVRIFITPYRTSLNEKDLIFSQGDFNVDVVMALGIKDRSQIDQAIAAHGRILHDATVISVNAGPGTAPQLGQLNWQEPTASSLCEMLVSISEAFGAGLIDNQMATAFLTGIVAETKRFSNNRTSPKVMTMAAQLMAAGANQQLIVSKLEPPLPATPKVSATPIALTPDKPAVEPELQAKVDGELDISHDKDKKDGSEVVASSEILIDKQGNLSAREAAEKKAAEPIVPAEPEPALTPPVVPLATPIMPEPFTPNPINSHEPQDPTANHALLNPANRQPSMSAPFSADMQSEWQDPYSNVSMDPLSGGAESRGLVERPQGSTPSAESAASPAAPEAPTSTPAPATDGGVESARSAVESAFAAAPFDPATAPAVSALNANPLGEDLHTPAPPVAESDTPSLTLPSSTNGTLSTTESELTPPADPISAAPPPLPPPLPLSSNPGAMLPNNPPTFQPPAQP